ncbi:MAG: hypothetical protein OEY47_01350 [Candidatus Bathyarchaeota archaeon]|nr:hypothetical protein [Candidatus Bathyarchaeota archaeon]
MLKKLKALICFLIAMIKTEMAKASLYAMRFVVNTKAESKATEWIMLTITLILGVILTPIIVEQVSGTNTTAWNFTGSAGAKTLFNLLPFVFVVGLVIYFIARLLGKV